MLARLAHLIVRRRRLVIGIWIVLTLFGMFSASQVSKRWLTQFSIPGYSAYEANQRTLHVFGNGEQAPMIAVFHASGDITKATGIEKAIARAQAVNKGSRVGSYFRPEATRTSRRTGTRRSPRSTRPAFRTSRRQLHQSDSRSLKAATPAGRQPST